MRILLVEDDPAVMMVTAQHIKSFGHSVVQANNGETAIELFQSEQIDLVIMDYIMPGLDGVETTKRLRELKPNTWFPILFLTSADQEQYLTQGLAAGGDDYVLKPVSPVVIEAKLKAMKRILDMQGALINVNDKLAKLTIIDSLTDVLNRRGFDKALDREWSRMIRNNSQLSLLLIDVDCFKDYNDHYGHQAGDKTLQQIAESLKSHIYRPGDAIARYGGEEFAVILSETDTEGAKIVTKRLLESVEEMKIEHSASHVKPIVTVSIGVASSSNDTIETSQELIKQADSNLYQAKTNGRAQFVTD